MSAKVDVLSPTMLRQIESKSVVKELDYSLGRDSSPIVSIVLHGRQHPLSAHKGLKTDVPETSTAWHLPSYVRCRTSLSVVVPDRELNLKDVNELRFTVRRWMKKYNIPPEMVLRHYDLSPNCLCPRFYVEPRKWLGLHFAITRVGDRSVS